MRFEQSSILTRKYLHITLAELREKFSDEIGKSVDVIGFMKRDGNLVLILEENEEWTK